MTEDEIRNSLSALGKAFSGGPIGLFVISKAQSEFPVPWVLIEFTWWLIIPGIILMCAPGVFAHMIWKRINRPDKPTVPPVAVILLLGCLMCSGCLTVTAPNGVRIMCTGNAKASVGTNGVLTVENTGTAETYMAIGAVVSKMVEGGAKGMSPVP